LQKDLNALPVKLDEIEASELELLKNSLEIEKVMRDTGLSYHEAILRREEQLEDEKRARKLEKEREYTEKVNEMLSGLGFEKVADSAKAFTQKAFGEENFKDAKKNIKKF